MSYGAKISRTGGSLKNLFVTGKKEAVNNSRYFCIEDNEYDPDLYSKSNHAELGSADDILSAWLDGLAEEAEQGE
ncbi:MAG: hypothetical protein H6681_07215 [Desulfobacteraceae bacterium]|nr:hypothetical protein [Desulfobacteraceae bacterium]MCB9495210.1 hypothetical protein [Desulfobacteraceae bacterium]